MNQVVKSTMKTEVIFDKAMCNKFLLKKEWDKTKKKALVLMKKVSVSEDVILDVTTTYTLNNLKRHNFGTAYITNLVTTIKGKETKQSVDENIKLIRSLLNTVDVVIIAVGLGVKHNKKLNNRLGEILAYIHEHGVETMVIEDKKKKSGLHPLSPTVRNCWNLIPYEWEEEDE